jgi:protein O-GlcNAc transferase
MNITTIEDQMYEQAAQLHAQGRLPEAEALYRQVLARRPSHGQAMFGLGTVAHQYGKNDVAVEILRQAAALVPTSSLFNNLGEAYRALGRVYDACDAYRRAIALNPQDAMPYNNVGIVLCLLGKLREADESWRKAISINPVYTDAYNNLGNLLLDEGKPEEAVELHRKVLALDPRFTRAHSNLLRDFNHVTSLTTAQMRAEHEAWWKAQTADVPAKTAWANSRDPNRPIRIGLVSPDFRDHSVTYFIEPWLSRRDRDKIKVFCYAELPFHDAVTARIIAMADGWRATMGVPDPELARQIEQDQIDVLLDLAGHTASNRLRVFAFRPAPVQVSFLGYPFTTGGKVIDWKITDALADPPGVSEAAYTEKLHRLPRTTWCYRPFAAAPAVAPSPVAANGHVTFGSFNSFAKVSPGVIETWAALLQRVPTARLLLKAGPLGDPDLCKTLIERFNKLGIDSSRLTLLGRALTSDGHLSTYAKVDIALDTFPYNGTTTTCEALWMGVPVVTVAGARHVERVGVSLLTTVGLAEFIAADRAGYVDIAAKLAGDPTRLAELRHTMRDRLRASPLTDEPGYAREFDAALRDMFRQWCNL